MGLTRAELNAQAVKTRKDAVLETAIALARDGGLKAVTRKAIGQVLGYSTGAVSMAFDNMDGLREEVLRQAVAREIPEVIASGLAEGSEIARAAPPGLKERALATLS